jgi:hypothetical protein
MTLDQLNEIEERFRIRFINQANDNHPAALQMEKDIRLLLEEIRKNIEKYQDRINMKCPKCGSDKISYLTQGEHEWWECSECRARVEPTIQDFATADSVSPAPKEPSPCTGC